MSTLQRTERFLLIINPRRTARVISRLSKINKKKAKGVAVYIDVNGIEIFWKDPSHLSSAGSLTQSEIIHDKIREFCRLNKLPLYTFAGNNAVGAGYYLLSMGFSSKSSQFD